MGFFPISEALQRLEREKLVESRRRAGTRVRTPTTDEVRGRTVVRAALESESARICCERATFQERLELRRMAENVDTLLGRTVAGEQRDTDFLYAVHQQLMNLHLRIAECARCPELQEAIQDNHVLIYHWFFNLTPKQPPSPTKFHQ